MLEELHHNLTVCFMREPCGCGHNPSQRYACGGQLASVGMLQREGAGQSDRKSLPSVRSVFVHLSDAGTVEVVVCSTLVGIVTSFRTCRR